MSAMEPDRRGQGALWLAEPSANVLCRRASLRSGNPIERVTAPNVAIPYATNAEARVIPGEAEITATILGCYRGRVWESAMAQERAK
jgi:pyruvate/2-oxoglutarate/acetoin dehydrogenase E1 component